VLDRCEVVGDGLSFDGDAPVEIAYFEYFPGEYDSQTTPTETSPGLHVYLRGGVTEEGGRRWRSGKFSRRLVVDGTVQTVDYAQQTSEWWVISPTHVMALVRDYQQESIKDLVSAGIRQGDANRNGIYGADGSAGDPIAMLNPGRPDESYLISRLVGKMQGVPVPGTRMPLANLPPTTPEMLALACFVEGLPTNGIPISMTWPINYKDCSYAENPEALTLTGTGATWSGRVQPLLQANCGGCHGGSNPSAGLDLLAANAYDRLMGPSAQVPGQNFVEPNTPAQSYLWLKLTDDPSITGLPMPQDPQLGYRRLSQSELDDVEAWINAGALED